MPSFNFTIHPDARVYLQEADRPAYGGARVIDVHTFRTQHPDIQLAEGFIIGLYHYEGPFTTTNQGDK